VDAHPVNTDEDKMRKHARKILTLILSRQKEVGIKRFPQYLMVTFDDIDKFLG